MREDVWPYSRCRIEHIALGMVGKSQAIGVEISPSIIRAEDQGLHPSEQLEVTDVAEIESAAFGKMIAAIGGVIAQAVMGGALCRGGLFSVVMGWLLI